MRAGILLGNTCGDLARLAMGLIFVLCQMGSLLERCATRLAAERETLPLCIVGEVLDKQKKVRREVGDRTE